MKSSRRLSALMGALAGFLGLGAAAHANLFVVDISTRTYSLNGRGELTFRAGNQRQIIDLAAQNSVPQLDAKALVLVYDTDADALEVVRKSDGSLISTVMNFVGGLNIQNAGKTRVYRQDFISITGTGGSIAGSVDGSADVHYDHQSNITAYRWHGEFQYSIPGDQNTPNRIVHGLFTLGRELHVKSTP